MSLVKAFYNSPVGELVLLSDEHALLGVWFTDQKYAYGKCNKDCESGTTKAIEMTIDWLDAYFNHLPLPSMPELDPKGSSFQREVFSILTEIPYGQTNSYKGIADRYLARTGKTAMSCQAIGQAIGHNPISILIPCHRVIGSNGHLTGYAGGIERKKWLLKHEGNSCL